MIATGQSLRLSVVVPAHNEQDNLRRLVQEIAEALESVAIQYEIVIVDDGSGDNTATILGELLAEYPQLIAIRMAETLAGRGHGQSAAFHAGFRASQGELIATLDGDCQNDPADIPGMLELMEQTGADLVQGDRTESRCDGIVRRASALVGLIFRRTFLGDVIRDTGCSLRLMRREVALAIPLEYRGMHRYIPITARHLKFAVVEMPVKHRPRAAGRSNYGIWNRAWPGLFDCMAVRWMLKQRRPVRYDVMAIGPRSARPPATRSLEPTGSRL